MGMKTCKDCGKPMSSAARACPNCGRPARRTSLGTWLVAIFVAPVIIAAFINDDAKMMDKSTPRAAAQIPAPPPAQKTAEEIQAENARCRADLHCWAESAHGTATSVCRQEVESRAKYQVKWDDGLLDSKFDHVRWGNESLGSVVYSGQHVLMQNGFGAWQRMVYFCTFNPGTNMVSNVEVRPFNP